jgi:NAD(P)-dependent dehydrogenase (short-subunit alcohol dehydrogenase family)
LGGECIYKHCDVADGEAWQALVDTVVASYGRLDVVHCNAYTLVVKPIHELLETEWRRQIDVCLGQVFHAGRTCLPLLRANRGALVITSSVHALVGLPGHPAYASAKGAIVALTRQLACDYGPEVRVNTVLPGAIDTPAWDGASDDVRQAYSAQIPLKRFGSADEVASSICYLASDDASYITGASLVVDGGWTATRV